MRRSYRVVILLLRRIRLGRAARIVLLGIVVGYAALLRFDALTLTYGMVEGPGWLRTLQTSRGVESALRPSSFRWERWQGRYISDPYTYLQYAREKRSFYEAHRREPVFPFATRIHLRLLRDQDIAVSFTSMFFSIVGVAGTFVLGYYAFSYWVGIGAAAAMAIEFDVITWGIGGWRDDAFVCAVVFSAWGMIRYQRVESSGSAVLLGAIAGGACLVRITSLSFLVPAIVWMVATAKRDWRARAKHAALTVLVGVLIAGPYVVNCWREFGDPLYAINVHADIYRATEGQMGTARGETAARYVLSKFRSQPWDTVDTAVLGLTEYPFANKWYGFDRWHPLLGKALSWSAIVGLFLFLGSGAGRLLLIVLAASLVPYMLTWKLIYDWRFTLHVYPFFLIAAALSVATVLRVVRPHGLRTYLSYMNQSALVGWTGAAIVVSAGLWITQRVMPIPVAKEALRQNEPVSLMAGPRDRAFFADGWRPAETGGNVTARVTEGPRSKLWLPLPDVRDYDLTIRLDPHPRPSGAPLDNLPTVHVYVNSHLLQVFEVTWNAERVGAYTVPVPKAFVNKGRNQLELSALTKWERPARVRLWYVRIHP
jgi:hypothetical protein